MSLAPTSKMKAPIGIGFLPRPLPLPEIVMGPGQRQRAREMVSLDSCVHPSVIIDAMTTLVGFAGKPVKLVLRSSLSVVDEHSRQQSFIQIRC